MTDNINDTLTPVPVTGDVNWEKLQPILALVPGLRIELQKEFAKLIDAVSYLEVLKQTLNVRSFKEVAAKVQLLLSEANRSVDRFVERVRAYVDLREKDETDTTTLKSLVGDFKKLKVAEIKEVAKVFDLNISKKSDSELFEIWLETGVKPLVTTGCDEQQKQELFNEAKTLYLSITQEFSVQNCERLLEIGKETAKQFKKKGLQDLLSFLEIHFVKSASTNKLLEEFNSLLWKNQILKM